MQRVLVILLFLVFLSACKKDKLEGDAAMLIGKWKWVYTNKLDGTYPFTNNATYTPVSEGKSFSVEFTHTGKIFTYDNSTKKKCYRLVFHSVDPYPVEFRTGYTILPDNKKKNQFSIDLYYETVDTILMSGFYPFDPDDVVGADIYWNYFIREN